MGDKVCLLHATVSASRPGRLGSELSRACSGALFSWDPRPQLDTASSAVWLVESPAPCRTLPQRLTLAGVTVKQ